MFSGDSHKHANQQEAIPYALSYLAEQISWIWISYAQGLAKMQKTTEDETIQIHWRINGLSYDLIQTIFRLEVQCGFIC